MGREIKFRAWNGMNMFEVCDIDFSNNKVGEMFRHSLRNEYDTIEDVELVQYTGAKDSDGMEIYEGDVVQVTVLNVKERKTELVPAVIEYIAPNFAVRVIKDNEVILGDKDDWEGLKVIGNIYENPELLEAK